MDTTLIRGEDGALSDALAGILSHLRNRRYGPGTDLHREADGFVERLAEHLRFAEATVLPALRKAGWGTAGDLEELEKDHRVLALYARDLATQLRSQDKEGAYGIARPFLAVLLDHLHRESDGVRRCGDALELSDDGRLNRIQGD